MRIVRTVIVPAALALGVAGSLLAGPAVSSVAAQPASTQVVALTFGVVYHG
jgi:hypothetical protein